VLAEVRRGAIVESRHRGHVVQVAADGSIERAVGDPDVIVSLRSTVKPFSLVALVESGGADDLHLSAPELAIMAASHTGEDKHVRTLQAVFRRAGVSQALLACGSEGMPADRLTAKRLARDGEEPGPIRHMCSGFHAASILLSRFSGWSMDDYADPEHPSQQAVRATVARLFGTTPARLVTSVDDCGLETYFFPLADVARAYALLADPSAADDAGLARSASALVRIRDAMMAAPDLVGGTRDVLDTMLMQRRPGALVSKGGAEGLRGIGLVRDSRGPGRPAAGLAIRIEDGDGFARANRSVTVEALGQLGVLDDRALRALSVAHRPTTRSPAGHVIAETVPGFELAPISELL
jgi:L-asparaginase II